jgi:hypothetical protein
MRGRVTSRVQRLGRRRQGVPDHGRDAVGEDRDHRAAGLGSVVVPPASLVVPVLTTGYVPTVAGRNRAHIARAE